MRATFYKLACASVMSALLTACGGGGGGGSNSGDFPGSGIDSPLTFHPRSGFAARINSPTDDNFTIEYKVAGGGCTGNANFTTNPARPPRQQFEGVDSLAVDQTGTISCSGQSSTASGTTYFDVNNYGEIGFKNSASNGSTEYDVLADQSTSPPALPVDAKTGDTGTLSTLTVYRDNSKGTPLGKRILSYEIGKDTTTTAILVLVNQLYDADGNLQVTQRSSYQMAADGTLKYKSLTVNDVANNRYITYTSVN